MKISQKLAAGKLLDPFNRRKEKKEKVNNPSLLAESENRISWSFEYFPPKTDNVSPTQIKLLIIIIFWPKISDSDPLSNNNSHKYAIGVDELIRQNLSNVTTGSNLH